MCATAKGGIFWRDFKPKRADFGISGERLLIMVVVVAIDG